MVRVIYATIIVCCVAALAYFQRCGSQLETQDSTSCSTYCDSVKQSKIKRTETKARWLIVIVTDDCRFCRELKKEIQDIQAEGYLVTVINKQQWDRTEINFVPTLLYFRGGEILYTEIGFRTADHIKTKLEKP